MLKLSSLFTSRLMTQCTILALLASQLGLFLLLPLTADAGRYGGGRSYRSSYGGYSSRSYSAPRYASSGSSALSATGTAAPRMNVLSPAKAQQRFTTNKTATKTPNTNPNRDVPTAKSTATSPQAQPMTAGMAGGVGGGMMGNFIGTAVSAVVGSVIGNSIAHALFGGFGGGQAMAPQQPPAVDANGNPLPAPTSPSNPLQGMIGFFWGLITLGFQLFLVAVLGLFGFKFLRKLWVGTKP